MKFIGIDPGLDGAVCIVHPFLTDVAPLITIYDTPTLTVKSGKKNHRVMDVTEAANILRRRGASSPDEVCVVLERVASMPGQGVASMFSFGMNFGMWQGILAALQLPYTLVHSRTWKAALMRDMGKEKEASIVRAKQLYPQAASSLTLKKHDGRADALLLAHYGRAFLQGNHANI